MNKRSKWKRKLLAAAAALLLTPSLLPQIANAYKDESNISDWQFFGHWNGTNWDVPAALDYGYTFGGSQVLTTVKNDVMANNYTQAQQDLLTYFKTRSNRQSLTITYRTSDTTAAEFAIDDIFSGASGEAPIGTFNLNQTAGPAQIDVTTALQNASNDISFMFMGRYKGIDTAVINSKEATTATLRPYLQYTLVGDPITYQLYPSADTYIRPGTLYADQNYGSSQTLNIRGSGLPYDENEQRAYIVFPASSITGNIQSASLVVNGNFIPGTGSTSTQMAIAVYNASPVIETSATWKNTLMNTVSWQGAPSGINWESPGGLNESIISRFNYAPKVASAYNTSSPHDERYANNLLRQITGFIKYFGNDPIIQTPYNQENLDITTRVNNWLQAYDIIRGSSSIDAGANTSILKYLWKAGSNFYTDANYRADINWGTFESQSLFNLGVYFPEFVASADWTTAAKTRLESQVQALSLYDGTYAENSTFYTAGELSTFIDIKNMAKLNGISLSGKLDTFIQQLAKYVMDSSYPDHTDIQQGDGDRADRTTLVQQVGNFYSIPDFQNYQSSSYTSVLDAGSKQAYMRTGWTANDKFMSFSVKEGNHGNPDLLSVTAYVYGKPLIANMGRYSYNNDIISNWLRLDTESRNTIKVDSISQTVDNKALNLHGDMNKWASNASFDFVEGTSNAYASVPHTRNILFIRDGYWIVSDLLKPTSGSHSYNQTWHMLPDANPTIDATTKMIKSNSGNGDIEIVPFDGSSLSSATLENGYYSPKSGIVSSAVYGSYKQNTVSGNVTFDTVLYPTLSTSTLSKDITVSRLSTGVGSETATAAQINLPDGATGVYYLSHETAPTVSRTYGSSGNDYTFNGKIAYAEKLSNGLLSKALLASGSSLKQGALDVIVSSASVPEIGVKWNGTTLEVNGASLQSDTNPTTAIKIYAPTFITNVMLNGTTVASPTRIGDYIYAVGIKSPGIPIVTGATSTSNGQLTLNWKPVDGATGYNVYIGTSSGIYGSPVAAGNSSSFTFNNKTNGTIYYMAVTATNSSGESNKSEQAVAQPMPAPSTPVIVSTASGDQQVTINIKNVPSAEKYYFYYGTSPTNLQNVSNRYTSCTDSILNPSCTIKSLTNGTTYYFAVSAWNDSGESAITSVQSVVPTKIIDTPTISGIKVANNTATVMWKTVTGATGYTLQYGNSTGRYYHMKDLGNATSFSLPMNGAPFYFVVAAYNSSGTSLYSKEVAAPLTDSPFITLYADADAYVQNGSAASTNYGSDTKMYVQKTSTTRSESLLRFDLSAVSSSILSAQMQLMPTTANNASSAAQTAVVVNDNSWNESTVTWNTKPAQGATAASWTGPVVNTPKTIDITSAVTNALSGDKKLSLSIYNPNTDNSYIAYGTKENGKAINVPMLTIMLQPQQTSLTSTADSFVRDGSYASTNYGSFVYGDVKKSSSGFNREVYIQFDTSSITGPISKATVILTPTTVASHNLINNIEFVDNSWSETGTSGITWNNKPSSSSVPFTTWVSPSQFQPLPIDVTSQVIAAMANSDHRISLRIYSPVDQGSNGSISYGMKENTISDFQPKLIIIK
ncbi:CBM96 family carbohydrate-binding protein [Paenibacillus roseipurpureus]|uniref:DNRLRE domain-containing protein n=1 Tax=Paenibacillus roseopurpureus TaxID=2918901 RepID=A0AA96LJS5_9BACL|nr:DNRLRE domain-containing protein [Paenibacillus sp. MBLB1832]WNR43035.1 DNRLRE domain-containing protein [Paenibacillus sp. MBLB1832]